jgi:hypothetical protein
VFSLAGKKNKLCLCWTSSEEFFCDLTGRCTSGLISLCVCTSCRIFSLDRSQHLCYDSSSWLVHLRIVDSSRGYRSSFRASGTTVYPKGIRSRGEHPFEIPVGIQSGRFEIGESDDIGRIKVNGAQSSLVV